MVSVGALLLGLALGVRHAFEPDHVAAVSTMLRTRIGFRRAAFVGACWGIGHSLTLVLVASVLIISGTQLPERVVDLLELVVAAVLVVLGVRALWQAVRLGQAGRVHAHQHGDQTHTHAGPEDHFHVHNWTIARQPLLVGLTHGIAGSGALAALALAQTRSLGQGLLYVGAFALGSIVAMAAATALSSIPIGRIRPTEFTLKGTTGLLSLAVGLMWGIPRIATLLG